MHVPGDYLRDAAAVRDGAMDDGRGPHHVERPAAAAARQPGDVRADRHAAADRRYADARDGDVSVMNVDYPFHFDARGRTAQTGEDDHVRDMIEQLLFTSPGERVNRPD